MANHALSKAYSNWKTDLGSRAQRREAERKAKRKLKGKAADNEAT